MSKMNEVSKEEGAQAEFFRNYELARVYQDLENQKIAYKILIIILCSIIVILLAK